MISHTLFVPTNNSFGFAAGRWFSPVSSTNKTVCHDIIEILLQVKVTLNTHNPYPFRKRRRKRRNCWSLVVSFQPFLSQKF